MEWWETYFSEVYNLTSFASTLRAKKEVDFILDHIELRCGAHILDMCCGDGRHALELAKRGYNVCGIDYSDELLRIAEEKVPSDVKPRISFIKEDMRKCSVEEFCDLTLSMFISLGYFDRDEDNFLAIKKLCNSVKSGGHLFIELHNYFKAINSCGYTMRIPGGIIYDKRYYDAEKKSIMINRVVKRKEDMKVCTQHIRIFTLEEITDIISDYGFNGFRAFGDYSGSVYAKESERLILLSRKT